MDILKNISESEERDIIVSLPNDKTWLEYLAYFLELKASGGCIEVIMDSVPKTKAGNKCFVVYGGLLRGWMEISKITEKENNDICIELKPYLSHSIGDIPMNEIKGFKYYFDNFNKQ